MIILKQQMKEFTFFNNNMYRVDLQGVMNMHRIMHWEEFTDTFGLQLHFGPAFLF